MTDSPTHGREHEKGRRAECKREAIRLRFLTEIVSQTITAGPIYYTYE